MKNATDKNDDFNSTHEKHGNKQQTFLKSVFLLKWETNRRFRGWLCESYPWSDWLVRSGIQSEVVGVGWKIAEQAGRTILGWRGFSIFFKQRKRPVDPHQTQRWWVIFTLFCNSEIYVSPKYLQNRRKRHRVRCDLLAQDLVPPGVTEVTFAFTVLPK